MASMRRMLRIAVCLVAAAGLSAASVELVDGTVVDGRAAFAAGALSAPRALALAEVARITPDAPGSAATGRGVWLADGGWLPADLVAAGEDALRISLGGSTIELPLTAVLGWGGDLPQDPGKGDVVVVAAGPVPGRVEGLRDGVLLLRTELDPEPIRIPLGEIQAVRLAGAARPPKGVHLAAAWRDDRPPTLLAATAQGLALAGAGIAVPFGGWPALTVENGRLVPWSRLDPAAVAEEGAFGTVWPWQRDRGIDGDPLRLGTRTFRRGIAVHSKARIAWTLDGAYTRLRATAGISALVAPDGDCPVRLDGDGRELWSARLTGRSQPVTLDLDLAGVRELVLSIDYGERYDIADHVVFGDAVLIRKP